MFHTEDVEMRSAERRALIVLGITAVISAIFAAMLGTIWAHQANETSFIWNVPANSPVPHVTYFPYYILEFWLAFWVAYAGFEFVYFSPDWFHTKWRIRSHKMATILIGFYVIYISTFVPLVYLDVVYVNSGSQFFVYEWIIVFITVLELEFVLRVLGSRNGLIIPKIVRGYRGRKHPPKEMSEETD